MTALPLRIAATFALATAVALAGAGCSKSSSDSQSPSVTTTVGPTETASAAPTSSAVTSPSATKTSGGGTTTVTYPTTPKAYAQALLSAWGSKNSSRIDQLATQAAVQQIKDNGYPNATWTYIACDASGDTTSCLFRNAHGDECRITLNTIQIGHPTAVTEALLSKTTYPTTTSDYVSTFINAWRQGNTQRMTRLANSTVTSGLKGKSAPEGGTMVGPYEAGRVQVSVPNGPILFYVEIDPALLGKAHAIGKIVPAS
ncbi:MAG: hypothetical protein HOV79_23265 [Hamadaea sp.]|nr:hypothetical protein [Hamadaea sp.]